MKEATGELNMTVITVVAIAAVAAFFYAFVWPMVKNNITSSTRCANAICTPSSCTPQNGRNTCTDCRDASDPNSQAFSCVFQDDDNQNN